MLMSILPILFCCVFFIFLRHFAYYVFFFFNDTATTEIYTLSLHDALPIYLRADELRLEAVASRFREQVAVFANQPDRKSTRLNSSHLGISYAVFCLKKKNRSWQLVFNRHAIGSVL